MIIAGGREVRFCVSLASSSSSEKGYLQFLHCISESLIKGFISKVILGVYYSLLLSHSLPIYISLQMFFVMA